MVSNTIKPIALASFLFFWGSAAMAQHIHTPEPTKTDTIKGSIKQEVHAMIGANHFTILYHSPAVRGRVIWGGLVAYNQVWVTGAHNATSIEFTKDVSINGKKISAGKYAFFTIPNKGKWTVIFNKNWQQHLADDYNIQEDVLRFEVKPKKQKNHVERLKYELSPKNENTGEFSMKWEKLKIQFNIENL